MVHPEKFEEIPKSAFKWRFASIEKAPRGAVKRCLIFDVANILYGNNQQCSKTGFVPDVRNLLAVMQFYVYNDFEVIGIILHKYVKEFETNYHQAIQELIKHRLLHVVNKFALDDKFAMELASQIDGVVLTCDKFADHRSQEDIYDQICRGNHVRMYGNSVKPSFQYTRTSCGQHFASGSHFDIDPTSWSKFFTLPSNPRFEIAEEQRCNWTPERRVFVLNLLEKLIVTSFQDVPKNIALVHEERDHMTSAFSEWKARSVFLEALEIENGKSPGKSLQYLTIRVNSGNFEFFQLKPRCDLAGLYIDCPPEDTPETKPHAAGKLTEEQIDSALREVESIRFQKNSIHIGPTPTIREIAEPNKTEKRKRANSTSSVGDGSGASTPGNENGSSGTSTPLTDCSSDRKTYEAKFSAITLNPDTVSGPTWTDRQRVFMCKIQAAPNFPLVNKTFHQLATEMDCAEKLEELSQKGNPDITCARCDTQLLLHEYKMSIGVLPDDDWFSTQQSADFYCRDSCGASCDPEKHCHAKAGSKDNKIDDKWLPTEKRLMMCYTNVYCSKPSSENINEDGRILKCAVCQSELGKVEKNHPNIYSLNHIAVNFTAQNVSYLDKRSLPKTSIYMAKMILAMCEAQGSLKLVIRSLDKTPHLLIWLLDSYVVAITGELKEKSKNSKELVPFTAIKLLYKLFDTNSAASDPRANGEDSSVGVLEIPMACCMKLMEILLKSSHRLPPPCRSVGKFYVGFLQLAEQFE